MRVQYTPMEFVNKIKDNNYSYTSSRRKMVREADTGVEAFQKNIDQFKESVKNLKNYSSGITTRSPLKKRLEELVQAYDKIDKNADDITDKDLKKQLSNFKKLFSDNEKDLKKAGIKKSKEKLVFDTEAFDEADDKSINRILQGRDSFISQADKAIRKVKASADNAEYNSVERKINKTAKYKEEDMDLVLTLANVKKAVAVLGKHNDAIGRGSLETDIGNAIRENLKLFAQSVYKSDLGEGYLTEIKQWCKGNEQNLAELGLKFESDNNMYFDNEKITDMSGSAFESAYKNLFGDNAKFKTDILDYCQNTIDAIIDQKKLGISIIDEQI